MTPAAAYTRPASTMLPQQNKLSLRGVQAQAMPAATSMQAYSPYNAKKYETFGYLPELTNEDIMKQIRFMLANNWPQLWNFQMTEMYI